MRKRIPASLFRLVAFGIAISLAACTQNTTNVAAPVPPIGSAVLSNVVAMGDSLTFGEQSNGLLGDASLPDPFYTGINVPPGQESGWFSQFYMQAIGATYAAMANPATSVLPLIKEPGLGDQLVPNNPGQTGVSLPFLPLSSAIPGHGCDTFNQAAYSQTGFSSTRLNPSSQPKDLGIPGITLHEAITLYQPPSPTCAAIAGAPASVALLQQLLSESGAFYPVLGTFTNVSPLTQLNAALSLHPSLTLVWLGNNDLLHFAFSGGTFTGVDTTAAQVQADMTQIITSLQHAGSNVVVANLPNVIQIPFFFSMAIPAGTAQQVAQQCSLQNYLWCVLVNSFGQTPPNAAAVVGGIAAQYNLGTTGYLTLSGFLDEAQAAFNYPSVNLDTLAASGNGNGSNYVTPTLAAAIQTENTALNTGINAAIAATGAVKVDVQTAFQDIATGNAADPYAAQALSVNPGVCCSLAWFGGLSSFDSIHPSNTGYALLANMFIDAINTKYGTSIPDINIAAVYAGTGKIPFPDPYALP
jgi:lysophospholipase L1-like esterase